MTTRHETIGSEADETLWPVVTAEGPFRLRAVDAEALIVQGAIRDGSRLVRAEATGFPGDEDECFETI